MMAVIPKVSFFNPHLIIIALLSRPESDPGVLAYLLDRLTVVQSRLLILVQRAAPSMICGLFQILYTGFNPI
ncbi:hypothetical protein GQ43DRAFT_97387 [Delitschia confertaspora ATCC 74209]|uniref:Uncharacterized protein n=1 Tax=Delitschia confertaspora ATCC 74209 TaxID=1513339 RepID=A0A9P4MRH1_9PLEO|nr:hypothetical protein GQ43DRAFT_97387 [Delitschia confertaspora ATCC 74209]